MKCQSGKHEWQNPADAEKCCTPRWIRCLGVGCDADFKPFFYHFWMEKPWMKKVPRMAFGDEIQQRHPAEII